MKYEYWFASIHGLGRKKKIWIRQHITSAKELYNIEEKGWNSFAYLNEKDLESIREHRAKWDLDREYEKLQRKQIHFLPWFHDRYPKKLLEIADMPYAIYLKGNLPTQQTFSAAIVGARNCTPYGSGYATRFAGFLAMQNIPIISGLARGIDGYVHRGALQAGGKTFAVLGCGVDICYPREHLGLYMDILENEGGILSEQIPGTPPLAAYFPQRNRIISGLSDVVLVMEAKEKSGALITADLALEQGKDVYALPGGVDSLSSRGCNRLIHQGAGILLSPEEFCENMKISNVAYAKLSNRNEIALEKPEK